VQRVQTGRAYDLHTIAATRQLEAAAQHRLPANTLMQRAGLAVAKLALATYPHAQRIWFACGPGNNGGDGLEAAALLQRWGKSPCVSWLGQEHTISADTAAALQRARAAGVRFVDAPAGEQDLCVDALLGIGATSRALTGTMADWTQRLNACRSGVLAIDLPSGLNADCGMAGDLHVQATDTLSLLTLKPGLFTAQGRDAVGRLWFDDLGCTADVNTACATLLAPGERPMRRHDSHKGSYGDVVVLGGARGMNGAAMLAATAALHQGAGRVWVCLLDDACAQRNDCQPELMFRAWPELDLRQQTVVCGCGAGPGIRTHLKQLIALSTPLVLDADALNVLAQQPELQSALGNRPAPTVLTPHPLEAARLLGCSTDEIQQNRLLAARSLTARFNCTLVLKGSGTVVSSPGHLPAINLTGNARLASAGSGDVLAGMIGAELAGGLSSHASACQAVYQHGRLADQWPQQALTASRLARAGRTSPPPEPGGISASLAAGGPPDR